MTLAFAYLVKPKYTVIICVAHALTRNDGLSDMFALIRKQLYCIGSVAVVKRCRRLFDVWAQGFMRLAVHDLFAII